MDEASRAARLCRTIDRNEWAISAANIVAALAFVAGCIAFYSPALHAAGVTLFLLGSVVWFAAGVADAFRRHGPAK